MQSRARRCVVSARAKWKTVLVREIDALSDEACDALAKREARPRVHWHVSNIIANTSEALWNIDPKLSNEYAERVKREPFVELREPFVELRTDALLAFVEAIDATGGVVYDGQHHAPVADEEWIDLGEAYLKACLALGREAKVTP